jgi:hypothetical protein
MSFLERHTYAAPTARKITQQLSWNVPVRCQNSENAKRKIQSDGTFEHGHAELHDRVEEKVHLDGYRHGLPSHREWKHLANNEPRDWPEPHLVPANVHKHGK